MVGGEVRYRHWVRFRGSDRERDNWVRVMRGEYWGVLNLRGCSVKMGRLVIRIKRILGGDVILGALFPDIDYEHDFGDDKVLFDEVIHAEEDGA